MKKALCAFIQPFRHPFQRILLLLLSIILIIAATTRCLTHLPSRSEVRILPVYLFKFFSTISDLIIFSYNSVQGSQMNPFKINRFNKRQTSRFIYFFVNCISLVCSSVKKCQLNQNGLVNQVNYSSNCHAITKYGNFCVP